MLMIWTPFWPSSMSTSSGTLRSSRALRERQTTYRGHDGARRVWAEDRGESWERLTNRPQEFRDLGESVLALGQMDLAARATGIEFSQELGEVF